MSAVERRLREELEEAREEIRQLRELMLPRLRLPEEWGLTPQETRFFRALLPRDEVSYVALAKAIQVSPEADEQNVLSVVAVRVRRKMKCFGVVIRTIWGEGFQLVDRAAWLRQIKIHDAEQLAAASGYPVRDTPNHQSGYTGVVS